MRLWMTIGLLAVTLIAPAPMNQAWAKEDKGLSEELARSLLAQAASVPQAALDVILHLGAQATPQDLVQPNADAPLTLVCALLGGHPVIQESEFRWSEGVTPATLRAALSPTEVRGGERVARHTHLSILHPEYIRELRLSEGASDPMTTEVAGVVQFRAPDVYEGVVHFKAERDVAGWRVVEFSFAGSGVRTSLQAGHWRLSVPPRALTVNPLRSVALDLPKVGTVGAVPDAQYRIVISVTRDGWIRVPHSDDPVSLLQLQRWLAEQSSSPARRGPDGSSRLDILLDIDASTPWVVSQWIMQTCAHPSVRAYKIWLGATTMDAAGEGAILVQLPRDRGLEVSPLEPESVLRHKVKIFKLQDRGVQSDLRALYTELVRRQAVAGPGWQVHAEIVAPPPNGGGVAHGFVVGIVHACVAAGVGSIVFEGAAAPQGDGLRESAEEFKDYILAQNARPGVAMIKLGSDAAFLPGAGEFAEIPARGLVNEPWGMVGEEGAFGWVEELEEVEEVPEPLDPPEAPAMPDEADPVDAPDDQTSQAGGAFRVRGAANAPPTSDVEKQKAAALEEGLRWIAAHQAPDGGWRAQDFAKFCDGKPRAEPGSGTVGRGKALYDVGVTGLALQAFLTAGYTPRGQHPHAKVVQRGLMYLKMAQDAEGCFGPRTTQQYIYNHAMASVAMVEAYGMTLSPVLKGPAQRALDFSALARNPYFGWRYGIKPGDNDTSVTCWMFLAFRSAGLINADAVRQGLAAPLHVDEDAADGVRAWLGKVTDPETGRVGYVARGTGSCRPAELVDVFPGDRAEGLTAAATFTRFGLGEDPRKSKELQMGLALIAAIPPVWDRSSGRVDLYYWHWGTLAMFQAGGAKWVAWESALSKALLGAQRKDGDACGFKGSWDPAGPWGADGGRVYSTALMVLCLGAHHSYGRYLDVK